jgi:lipopolysaccharide export system permease protein
MIWQRYFLKELGKVFCLFLCCFYGLYVIIDYASHTSGLPGHHMQVNWKDLLLYYGYIFIARTEILIPLALLIAVVKTLCTLNVRNELVALMASGIRLKVLLRPFLFVGLFGVTTLYLNEQFFLPSALTTLQRIEDATKNAKHQKRQITSVQNVMLEDESMMLYQSYDTAHQRFFDVYWIRSIDEIYRMKTLSPNNEAPIGRFVDHLKRDPSGRLVRAEAFKERAFPEMRFNPERLQETLTNPDLLSIVQLWHQLPKVSETYSEKESQTLVAFYWKMGIPWLCLLAAIGPMPLCVRFTRQLPIFFIYVSSIFGLITFYLILDASLIVAKRQVMEPLMALGIPFGVVMGAALYRYRALF